MHDDSWIDTITDPPELDNPLWGWRRKLGKWPIEWRERWGYRANELEESGMSTYEAERLAWNETIKVKAEAAEAAKRDASPVIPLVPPTAQGLFRETA